MIWPKEKRLGRRRGNVRHRDVQGAHTPLLTGGQGRAGVFEVAPSDHALLLHLQCSVGSTNGPGCPGARGSPSLRHSGTLRYLLHQLLSFL